MTHDSENSHWAHVTNFTGQPHGLVVLGYQEHRSSSLYDIGVGFSCIRFNNMKDAPKRSQTDSTTPRLVEGGGIAKGLALPARVLSLCQEVAGIS